jgi:murein DD-endopeptidase MepM/ murein hydrolase activator NlpD
MRRLATKKPIVWLPFVCLALIVAFAAALLLTLPRWQRSPEAVPLRVTEVQRFAPEQIVRPPASAEWERRLLAEPFPVSLEVASGETFGQLFANLGLDPSEARVATAELAQHVKPRSLRAGTSYAAYFDPTEGLTRFELAIDDRGRVSLGREPQGWTSAWLPYERSVETRAIAGRLDSSLEQGITSAGASAVLAYTMADVLQWDLDFTRDLRVGDRFYVLYEEVYLDGDYASIGRILAMRYENRGRTVEAYRYGDGEGDSYYDAEGRPLRKMFLRSPLKFSRITSKFSRRRFHPVLKRYRPHYGVDYGAPVGTPVRVTSNGTVAFAGWNRGGGKTIKVRHPGGYETNYLHLSGFAKGMSPGRAVRQGEVVGYVGSTGLSTGPHLDYRVKRNGQWIDPLSIKTVPARALSVAERDQFLLWRNDLRARLDVTDTPLSWPTTAPSGDEQIADAPAERGGDVSTAAGR